MNLCYKFVNSLKLKDKNLKSFEVRFKQKFHYVEQKLKLKNNQKWTMIINEK